MWRDRGYEVDNAQVFSFFDGLLQVCHDSAFGAAKHLRVIYSITTVEDRVIYLLSSISLSYAAEG